MVGQYLLRRFDCRSPCQRRVSRVDSPRDRRPSRILRWILPEATSAQSSRRRDASRAMAEMERRRAATRMRETGRRLATTRKVNLGAERSRAVVKNEGTKRGIAERLDALRRGNMGRPDYVGRSTGSHWNLTVAEWRRKTSYISCITNARIYHPFVSPVCIFRFFFFFISRSDTCARVCVCARAARFYSRAPLCVRARWNCLFHSNATPKAHAHSGRQRLSRKR